MLIVEFCEYGDLQSYLRHCRGIEDKYYQQIYQVPVEKLGSKDLLSFSIQVARGMAHLASMKVRCYGTGHPEYPGVRLTSPVNISLYGLQRNVVYP
jgi:uncharacterized membrane protein